MSLKRLVVVFIISAGLSGALFAKEDFDSGWLIGIWGGYQFGLGSAAANPGAESGGLAVGLYGQYLFSKRVGIGLGFSSRKAFGLMLGIDGADALVGSTFLPILAELRLSVDPVFFQIETGYAFLIYSASGNYYAKSETTALFDLSGPAAGATIGLHFPFGVNFGLELFVKYLAVFAKTGIYSKSIPSMGITPGVSLTAKF